MNRKIKVTFRGNEELEFEEGVTYKQISDNFRHYYNYDILAAKVNNNIVDLSDTLTKKCNIDFFDRSSSLGNSIYCRSAKFILILAVKNVLGSSAKVIVSHSVTGGVYCTIEGAKINEEIIKDIQDEMKEISKQNYLFTKLSVSRLDAIKYYKKLEGFYKY